MAALLILMETQAELQFVMSSLICCSGVCRREAGGLLNGGAADGDAGAVGVLPAAHREPGAYPEQDAVYNRGSRPCHGFTGVKQADASMAVLLMEMLAPSASFVLHTASPLDRDAKMLHAEVAPGLGETLASGTRGSAWRLTVDKATGAPHLAPFLSCTRVAWLTGQNLGASDARRRLSFDEALRDGLGTPASITISARDCGSDCGSNGASFIGTALRKRASITPQICARHTCCCRPSHPPQPPAQCSLQAPRPCCRTPTAAARWLRRWQRRPLHQYLPITQ